MFFLCANQIEISTYMNCLDGLPNSQDSQDSHADLSPGREKNTVNSFLDFELSRSLENSVLAYFFNFQLRDPKAKGYYTLFIL